MKPDSCGNQSAFLRPPRSRHPVWFPVCSKRSPSPQSPYACSHRNRRSAQTPRAAGYALPGSNFSTETVPDDRRSDKPLPPGRRTCAATRKPQPSTDSCAAMRSRVQRKTVPVCRHRPAPAQTAPLYSLCLHFSQTIRPRFPYIIPLPEPDFSSRTPVLLISGWTLHRSIRRLRR